MTNRIKRSVRTDDLRRFYDLGVRSLTASPARLPYGEAEDNADGEGVHPEVLRKARQVAQEFSPKQLKTLLADCQRSGYDLGVSHLMRLASVRTGRSQLIYRMVKQRWSLRELNNEIARKAPLSSTRGRRRLIPPSHDGQMVLLKKECLRWQRLSEKLASKLNRPSVIRALQRATASITRLAATVDRA